MHHDRLVCLDIETVPDRTLIPHWDEGKCPPKPIWHRIVAISFVQASIERNESSESYAVTGCRSGGQADWDEQRLLSKFWQYFAESAPRVVTWNGKGFDLPVLRARAMMYGISAQSWYRPGNKWDNYLQRFAPDWHCDLMEQLSDYRACSAMKLDDFALAIGLPGKIGGHGSEVEAMMRRGEIHEVRSYCEADCLNLFVLYTRWALLSGRSDQRGHNASIQSLVECLERERDARPHFGEFLDAWRATTRPVPMFVSPSGMATARHECLSA
jgi:predicted PolB exonuclease-like 3'-5' exonuclease